MPSISHGPTLAVVLAALASACGGSTAAGPGTTTGATTSGTTTAGGGGAGGGSSVAPTADRACSDAQAARCARLDACTAEHGVAVRYGDPATCEARGKANCLTALAASGTGNTPAAVEACAAATPSESCDDLLMNNPPAACATKAGQAASGTPCAFAAQCQSTYCAVPKGAVCGTCAPVPKAGDSCVATGECGHDLVCPKATEVCVAYGAEKAACDAGTPCAPGLSCVGADAQKLIKGVCAADGAKAGAPCDAKHLTAAGCDPNLGLWCDPATNQCAAISFVAHDAPCGALKAGGYAECTGGATCVIPQGQKEGVCQAPAADGAACDTSAGPGCLQPAKCVVTGNGTAGTCKVPDGACK
jgi:hypothetical protein